MPNRTDAVQSFNKPWEQVPLHGHSGSVFRLLVIKRPVEAASKGPVLSGSPSLGIVPECIQHGQAVFNELLIKIELRLRPEESENSPRNKT